MGESPATYAHADQVARLTERIRRDQPEALNWAERQPLWDAVRQLRSERAPDMLALLVSAHQHLATTFLAHQADRDRIADEVLTAALYLTVGIDYAVTSIEVVAAGQPGRYTVRLSAGGHSLHLPVAMPAPCGPTSATPLGALR
ncbi:hypothetical protein [Polymorphospora sp. NPDC050346]|uniref:hypothetical protein n=1 Tax=Polymorphospora sp. NPDC050346 TaxID=3155780 RepID=UPI0033C2FE92